MLPADSVVAAQAPAVFVSDALFADAVFAVCAVVFVACATLCVALRTWLLVAEKSMRSALIAATALSPASASALPQLAVVAALLATESPRRLPAVALAERSATGSVVSLPTASH